MPGYDQPISDDSLASFFFQPWNGGQTSIVSRPNLEGLALVLRIRRVIFVAEGEKPAPIKAVVATQSACPTTLPLSLPQIVLCSN